MARIKILFKINGEVVVEEPHDMELKAIEKMKFFIAEECECSYHDIEVEKETTYHDLSDEVDVTEHGMMFFNNLYQGIITGVECCLEDGSDRYLDAMNDGSIIDYLNFNTK